MTTTNFAVPDEAYDAINRARERLDNIIPFLSEGNFGVAFARIDEVIEEVIGVARLVHESEQKPATQFFTAHYATNYVLKVIRNDEFFERVTERVGIS